MTQFEGLEALADIRGVADFGSGAGLVQDDIDAAELAGARARRPRYPLAGVLTPLSLLWGCFMRGCAGLCAADFAAVKASYAC